MKKRTWAMLGVLAVVTLIGGWWWQAIYKPVDDLPPIHIWLHPDEMIEWNHSKLSLDELRTRTNQLRSEPFSGYRKTVLHLEDSSPYKLLPKVISQLKMARLCFTITLAWRSGGKEIEFDLPDHWHPHERTNQYLIGASNGMLFIDAGFDGFDDYEPCTSRIVDIPTLRKSLKAMRLMDDCQLSILIDSDEDTVAAAGLLELLAIARDSGFSEAVLTSTWNEEY